MTIKLYERRYWDVSAGKVRAVFEMDKNAPVLNSLPDSENFMIWLDPEPEELTVDVNASIINFRKVRAAADSHQHLGVDVSNPLVN